MNDLEFTIKDLKLRLENSVQDCESAHNTIRRLENELANKKEKPRVEECDLRNRDKHELEKKSLKIKILQEENKSLRD